MYKKATGMMAGVADLIILTPNARTIFVEMKTEKGKQSDKQKEFEQSVKEKGFDYFVCRTFDEFKLLAQEQILSYL